MILKESADSTVRLEEVRRQFRERHWIDPDWARPDATIYAALVRLSDNDPHVIREGKKWWKFVSTPPLDLDRDLSPTGDADASPAAEVSTP